MTATLPRMLRLCALLAFFLVGAGGHQAAMAQGMYEQTPVVGQVHHQRAHDICDAAGCEQGPSCCVMGQCLIALPPTADCQFMAASVGKPQAIVLSGRLVEVVVAPFRPPAAV